MNAGVWDSHPVLLSVIIPVHAVEECVERCLQSIASQECQDAVEVVVVNDGTPDASMDIVRTFVGKIPSLTILDQQNKGLGAARNAGIAMARGDYLWMVDADDALFPGTFRSLVSSIRATRGDVIHVGIDRIAPGEDGLKVARLGYFPQVDGSVGGPDYLDEATRCGRFNTMAQAYVVNRAFFHRHGLWFFPWIYHEDAIFSVRLLLKAECVRFIDWPLYAYWVREGSITTKCPSFKRKISLVIVIANLLLMQFQVSRTKARRSLLRRVGVHLSILLPSGLMDLIRKVRHGLALWRRWIPRSS